jgi:hypothetical protein
VGSSLQSSPENTMNAIVRDAPLQTLDGGLIRRWYAAATQWLRAEDSEVPVLFDNVEDVVRNAAIRRAATLRSALK